MTVEQKQLIILLLFFFKYPPLHLQKTYSDNRPGNPPTISPNTPAIDGKSLSSLRSLKQSLTGDANCSLLGNGLSAALP